MTEVATFLCVIAWLFSGGWSFAYFIERDGATSVAGGLFIMCIALGPFMAGVAFAHIRSDRQDALSGDKP